MNEKWDRRFLELARVVSTWSKDPSTKCGAIIVNHKRRVISIGYNGFPSGMDDDRRLYENRQIKLDRVIHAEINAILNTSVEIYGDTIYLYPYTPCSRCAIHIIQAGIMRVVGIEPPKDIIERWGSYRSQEYFDEAQVHTCWYKGDKDGKNEADRDENVQVEKYEKL